MNDQAAVYGTLRDVVFSPEPIVAIVGRGRTGKTHLAGRIYSAHLYSGIYDRLILFDPYRQIDDLAGFRTADAFLARLEQVGTENGNLPELERLRILAVIDEADLIYDQWRRKEDFKEYLLRYNRHMGIDLVLTFRNIPKKDICLFANQLILFQHYNMELEVYCRSAGFDLDARAFGPRQFSILNL